MPKGNKIEIIVSKYDFEALHFLNDHWNFTVDIKKNDILLFTKKTLCPIIVDLSKKGSSNKFLIYYLIEKCMSVALIKNQPPNTLPNVNTFLIDKKIKDVGRYLRRLDNKIYEELKETNTIFGYEFLHVRKNSRIWLSHYDVKC